MASNQPYKSQSSKQSDEGELSLLEIVLAKSNLYIEIAATASLRSPELEGIMDLAREELDIFAPVTKVDYVDGVPVTPIVKFPWLRGQVELNQAVVYSMLIHLQGLDGLREERDLLLQRAKTRLGRFDARYARVLLSLYQGVIEYHNGAAEALKESGSYEIRDHLENAIEHLGEALEEAKGYTPFYESLTRFNLGRAHLTLGNRHRAQWHFDKASDFRFVPKDSLNAWGILCGYYHDVAQRSYFGRVIRDPKIVKENLKSVLVQMATTHTFPFAPLVSPEEEGRFTEAMAEALAPILDGYNGKKGRGNGSSTTEFGRTSWTADYERVRHEALVRGLSEMR